MDFKSGQRLQIGAREITNRGRDYKLVQNNISGILFISIHQVTEKVTTDQVAWLKIEGSVASVLRSSHQRCSIKKVVLKNFPKLTGKHQRQSLFFSKVSGFRPATLLKKKLWHKCFPVNFAKFLRTPLLQSTSE